MKPTALKKEEGIHLFPKISFDLISAPAEYQDDFLHAATLFIRPMRSLENIYLCVRCQLLLFLYPERS